jgi:hypothetical protein
MSPHPTTAAPGFYRESGFVRCGKMVVSIVVMDCLIPLDSPLGVDESVEIFGWQTNAKIHFRHRRPNISEPAVGFQEIPATNRRKICSDATLGATAAKLET